MLKRKERRNLCFRRLMLCLESGSDFLDVLFTFTAFLLVFGIGLGFGLMVKGSKPPPALGNAGRHPPRAQLAADPGRAAAGVDRRAWNTKATDPEWSVMGVASTAA
jgi:hypothetical protein